jgi:4'-phosphopantetheinyl transferase
LNPINPPGPPGEGFVHLWITKLRSWSPHTGELRPLLSRDEIDRLERLKIQQKAENFLSSRGILRLILSSYLDTDPQRLLIKTSPAGKPYLPNSAVSFNISHSSDYLLAGVTLKSRIGIDIQEIYPISNPERIIQHYYSPSEQDYLNSLPTREYQEGFFAIWTAKEAYLKAIGDGFQESPAGLSTIPGPGSHSTFLLDHPGADQKNPLWTILSLEIARNYQAALAVEGAVPEILRIPLSPRDCFHQKLDK